MGRNIGSAVSHSSSGTSGSFDMDTKTYNHPSSAKPTGRRMIYTGPNTTLFQRVNVGEQGRYIGIAPLSQEVTSSAGYLYSGDRSHDAPLCTKMKHQRPGEIGWNTSKLLKNSVLPVVIAPGRR